jgi:hypothetical protein
MPQVKGVVAANLVEGLSRLGDHWIDLRSEPFNLGNDGLARPQPTMKCSANPTPEGVPVLMMSFGWRGVIEEIST